MSRILAIMGCALIVFVLAPLSVPARESTDVNRYRGYEMSSGAYDDHEVRSFGKSGYLRSDRIGGMLGYAPGADRVRTRGRLVDAHLNVLFYSPQRSCASCHARNAGSRHVVRNGLTCRQCHGGEPIADNGHYYSPNNPLRRHAYVCAKCHQQAGASFATYRIHEPNPAMASTLFFFPLLGWAFWIMVGIAVLTFAVFVPHTFLWIVREVIALGRKGGGGS